MRRSDPQTEPHPSRPDESSLPPKSQPVPSRNDLVRIAVAGGNELVSADDFPVERLSFCRRRRRLAGIPVDVLEIAGRDFYDYTLALDNEEAREMPRRLATLGRELGADCVVFDQVLTPMQLGGSAVAREYKTFLVAAGNGSSLADLVRKHGSIRRHIRVAQRELAIVSETITERGAIRGLLPQLADLHRERWHFEGNACAFDDAARIGQYEAAAEHALITRVSVPNETVAVHYGLHFGDTLIWHTPAINIAFLEYSPLEILLGSVFESCAQTGIGVLDLRLGDEIYKARFATDVRSVYEYVIPLSMRGWAAATLSRGQFSARLRQGADALLSAARDMRNRLRQSVTTVRHFRAAAIDAGPAPEHGYREIFDWRDFVYLFRSCRLEVLRHHYERIRNGSHFACLVEDGAMLCSGWIWMMDAPFYVGETGERLPAGSQVLYDFVTPEKSRGRGHYVRLLKAMVAAHPGSPFRIFASSDNAASLAGIRKAGFEEIVGRTGDLGRE